jgi:DNA-binding response OmpR family regulator
MAGNRILIVDDDRDLLRGLTVRLKANGYEVGFAVDSISAMSAARENRPDVLILDIGLPGGDGFTVLDRFRSVTSLSAVPVIILTATDPAINRERALSAGVAAFLQKPADNQELLTVIREVLEESTSSVSEEPDRSSDESKAARKKILVVDDDPDLLRGLNIRLKASGHDIVVAADPIAAISKAKMEKPDLIILDIAMPGGDGFQVMERLKTAMPRVRIPIIIVSATDPSLNRERALQAGASVYLQKPVDNVELMAAIDKVLEGPRRFVV